MKITTHKQVPKEVTTGYKCDICGAKHDGDGYPKEWAMFTHQHHGWGNDSFESYEQFDLCSIPCFREQLKLSLHAMRNDQNTAQIFGMSYLFAKLLYEEL